MPVFNVRLSEPPDIPLPPAPKKIIIKEKEKPLPTLPPSTYRHVRPEPPDTASPPETIYGEGTGLIPSTKDTPLNPPFQEGIKGDVTGSLNAPAGIDSLSETDKSASSESEIPHSKPYTYLFDRETIEKFAQKQPPDKKGLTFEVPEFEHRGYMQMLKQKIESIWEYPKEAVRLGVSGDLYITFSIKRDGRLGDIELIRTSGHRNLDEAAIRAIKNAEPFWPLPHDWDEEELEINGHFIYILGRSFIM